jgi:catechol 2,3-dioxygenase-like lactoylglutathione lyase family enzyme
MIDHRSIQCSDITASAASYDSVLAPIGGRRVADLGDVIGYGLPPRPDVWIAPRQTGDGFCESHIAFAATTRAAVDGFLEAARGQGAEVLHPAKIWPEYHEHYYGAFVRDPDGNNVEAVCHSPG